MTNHVHNGNNGNGGIVQGDKKSHYTALLVGVIIGAMSSSVVLVAVSIAVTFGS